MHTPLDPDASRPTGRGWVALGLTVLMTLGALVWVWVSPEWSWAHFWWVAQGIPVLYVVLLWWVHGVRSSEPGQG